jgi:hypothetical protein
LAVERVLEIIGKAAYREPCPSVPFHIIERRDRSRVSPWTKAFPPDKGAASMKTSNE